MNINRRGGNPAVQGNPLNVYPSMNLSIYRAVSFFKVIFIIEILEIIRGNSLMIAINVFLFNV